NRHRFAPSYCPPGRDAAVAFNTIDLRLRNPYSFPLVIDGRIDGDRLVVRVLGPGKMSDRPSIVTDVRQVLEPRAFTIRRGGESGRVRNNGKRGYEVATYRVWKGRRELLSVDSYPAMHRVVEYR
ncbi:MAG TPA: VanW family protein, partial [Fimbriimonadaceae bacterium]|nr:VanW family protein [Fimbriimonadaceae bacterium]